MYKVGQILTIGGEKYKITKTDKPNVCDECGLQNGCDTYPCELYVSTLDENTDDLVVNEFDVITCAQELPLGSYPKKLE